MDLLSDLLPLRFTYASQAATPPDALIHAVDRMLPALRFFRHQDGSLARFNGMGATIHERIAAVLRLDDVGGQPLLHAPHSGYERLSMGDTTVIADTGLPPPIDVSNTAHAGFLSFELSSGRQHFIVNCGVDTFGKPELRLLSRATAAHSTATLNDASSARFNHSLKVNDVIGPPLIGGPKRLPCKRIDAEGRQGFVANHDGYVSRFGLYPRAQAGAFGKGGPFLPGSIAFCAPAAGSPATMAATSFPCGSMPIPTYGFPKTTMASCFAARMATAGCSLAGRSGRKSRNRSISPAWAGPGAADRSCCPSKLPTSMSCTGSSFRPDGIPDRDHPPFDFRTACATARQPPAEIFPNGHRIQKNSRSGSRSGPPRAAIGFGQDRPRRFCRSPCKARRRADLDRRHRQGDRGGGGYRFATFRMSQAFPRSWTAG